MVVRKKILPSPEKGDSIPLSSRLERVRKEIRQLNDEEPMEGETNDPKTTPAEASAPTEVKKAVKKTPTKGKTVPKKIAKKAVKKVAASNGAVTTLAELCKPLKLKPRAARRVLRDAKVSNPGRWSWPKGKVPATVTKVLKDAVAGE